LRGTRERVGGLMAGLESGSRVAVVGGGPAGSFFSYFLLEMAQRAEIRLDVDIYEPRDFSRPAPGGCNMCGGIVSESLVQMLSAEGISLPPTVVQRGIDAYVLHSDGDRVQVRTPLPEMRIGAVHRGGGPRDVQNAQWISFDGYLLDLACARGAHRVPARVCSLSWEQGRPRVHTRGQPPRSYDLLVGALGLNTGELKLFEQLNFGFHAPKTTREFIAEFHLGQQAVTQYLGSAMHVFLVNLPRLQFAALVPKGDYVTMCLLGKDVDAALVDSFLGHAEVRRCFPPGWETPLKACHCSPRMYMGEATHPYGDRVVLIGDSSVSRLYKNGIGAAYRTAKACAVTALFDGISAEDFEHNYWRVCQNIVRDNRFGQVVFSLVSMIKHLPFLSCAVINMARSEHDPAARRQDMSLVLWNTFTGSADYRDIFLHMLRPTFLATIIAEVLRALVSPGRAGHGRASTATRAGGPRRNDMRLGELGRVYADGQTIIRKGDTGDCMYVVLAGRAKVFATSGEGEIWLRDLGPGDVFGESAIFRRTQRSATVRASGETRVLSLNRRQFLSSVREDPIFEVRILEQMSGRVRQLTDEVVRLNRLLPEPTTTKGRHAGTDGAADR
jgi:flavin-dependent dehydrogenase